MDALELRLRCVEIAASLMRHGISATRRTTGEPVVGVMEIAVGIEGDIANDALWSRKAAAPRT